MRRMRERRRKRRTGRRPGRAPTQGCFSLFFAIASPALSCRRGALDWRRGRCGSSQTLALRQGQEGVVTSRQSAPLSVLLPSVLT